MHNYNRVLIIKLIQINNRGAVAHLLASQGIQIGLTLLMHTHM